MHHSSRASGAVTPTPPQAVHLPRRSRFRAAGAFTFSGAAGSLVPLAEGGVHLHDHFLLATLTAKVERLHRSRWPDDATTACCNSGCELAAPSHESAWFPRALAALARALYLRPVDDRAELVG